MRIAYIFAALLLGAALLKSSPVEARNHCHTSINFSFIQALPALFSPPPQPVYYAPAPLYAYPAPYYGGSVIVVERARPVRTVCHPRAHFGWHRCR